MNHKKSMHIFWLSLALLLVSGAAIIATAQFQAHKKAAMEQNAQLRTDEMPQADETVKNAVTPDSPTMGILQDQTDGSTQTESYLQQTNGNANAYLYELKIRNGYLEVYYYQTQQLFLNTGIPYHMLTTQQRQDLQTGKYFTDEQELYGYLESCTS